MSMDDVQDSSLESGGTVEVDGKTVDAETGEIKSDKVVDLRKKHKEDKKQ